MKVLILGDSNTAFAFKEKILNQKPLVKIYSDEDYISVVFDMIFVLYDDDSLNIKKCLDIRRHSMSLIYTKFKNEKLGLRTKTYIPNLEFINPAIIAAEQFTKSILTAERTNLQAPKQKWTFKSMDPLLKRSLKTILVIISTSTLYIHFFLHQTLFNSLYYTIETMVTGDNNSLLSSSSSKVFYMLLMISAVTCMAIIFALIGDSINGRRKELVMGVKKYKGKNHIIVIGGGSVGFHVIKRLISYGESPVLVDDSLDGPFINQILALGVPFIIGDGRDETLLYRAGIYNCKAVMSLTQNDLTNLEIGLDVKTIDPNLRVVLRIFDQDMAQSLREHNIIPQSHSMSYIAAAHLIKKIS